MKKITSAGSVVAAVVLSSMGFMGTAHATDEPSGQSTDSAQVTPHCVNCGDTPSEDTPPQVEAPKTNTVQSETVQSKQSKPVSDNQVEAASESLPNTGGPNAMLLGGALALVGAGGATVVVARRRQTT